MEKYNVYVDKSDSVILETGNYFTTLTAKQARGLGNTLLDKALEALESQDNKKLSPEMKYVMRVCEVNKNMAERIVKIAKERAEKSGMAFEEEVFGITKAEINVM